MAWPLPWCRALQGVQERDTFHVAGRHALPQAESPLGEEGEGAMSIKVKYDNGEITFNLVDLLEYVPKEQLAMHIEALSCNEQILAHVAEQIATGYTEWGYSGGRFCTPEPDENSGTALDKAIRRVAKASGEVAKNEIERLERALAYAEKSRDEYMSKMHEAEAKLRRLA
jgi:hypothetical protein